MRLILGDCLEVMKGLPSGSVDAVITDPPYGVNYKSSPYWNRVRIIGDDKPFNPIPFLVFPVVILFGANYYAGSLPVDGGWLIWDKRDRTSRKLPGSDGEMAWTNATKQVRIYCRCWMPHTIRGERKFHPTQKPVDLIREWIAEFTKPGDTILDPFMGSGTTGVACVQTGRDFIGIEIDPGYFAIAERRIKEAQAQGTLAVQA